MAGAPADATGWEGGGGKGRAAKTRGGGEGRDSGRGGGDAFMIAEQGARAMHVGRVGWGGEGVGCPRQKKKGGGERRASRAPCRRGAANNSATALAGMAAEQPGRVREWEVTPYHQAGAVAGRWWSPRCPHGPAAREGRADGGVREGGRPRGQAVKAVTVGAARHAVRGAGCRGPKFGRRHGRRQRAAAARHRSVPPRRPRCRRQTQARRLDGPGADASEPRCGSGTLARMASMHLTASGRRGVRCGVARRACGTWPAGGRADGRAPGRASERGGAGRVTRVPPREGAAGGFFPRPTPSWWPPGPTLVHRLDARAAR